MSLDAHPELIGTVLVVGVLVLAAIRQVIAWWVQRNVAWPLIAVTTAGIVFVVSRVIHLSTHSTEVALYMIRVQYGIGFVLPGIGMAAIEALSARPTSRTSRVVVSIGAVLFAICVATPAIVAGPCTIHVDALGHPYVGANVRGSVSMVFVGLAVLAYVVMRRRFSAMPRELVRHRLGYSALVILFALAGIHDSLAEQGVFRSVFVLEYLFVVVGILGANFELRWTAVLHARLEEQLLQKRLAIEEREASLSRAHRRLERSTTRYRHLAESTREGVILCSGFRVLDINVAACKLLGTDTRPVRSAELRSADLRTFVVESDRDRIDHMLSTDEGPFEVWFTRSDNSTIPVSVKSIPAPEGSTGTRVLLVRDISTERELQRRLATADRLAAVGTLAAGTAHEINNPLAFVLANADLLDESLDDFGLPPEVIAEQREMLADIKQGAHRIRDVVRDLMTLARDRGGEVTTIDLRETLRRCIAMAGPQTRHRARVFSQFDDPRPVRANEGRLFQVFLNLIVNAAQAIGEGAANKNSIRVSGFSKDEWTIIEITDTGSGMPASVIEHIFEPFFTTKEVGKGTGLGLSISHGIVTDLGGRIEVSSTVGVGTTFRVILPATVDEAAITMPIVKLADSPRLRVLVIDDEQGYARTLAKMLDAHDVDVAFSGRDALQQLAARRYDMALCDVMMPDVTGIQLYQQLREAHDPIADHFLFMTGGVSTPEAQQFLEKLGTERWVAKPIAMADLRRLVVEIAPARPLAAD